MSNFSMRTISRWVMVGAIGLGAFGMSFAFRISGDSDSGTTLWLYGVLTALSILALGIGLYRTRRKWTADLGA